MCSARSMVRRILTSFSSPRVLIGIIGSFCLLGVLVVFHPRVNAVEGTLNVTATTASYSGTMTQAGNQPIRTAFGPLRLDYKSGPNNWTTGFLMREGDGNVTVGAGITSADFHSQSKLRVLGVVESTTGGFKFPDGTTQTTAASAAVGGGWTDGGTNIYTTTASDKVGIGTSTIDQALDVYKSGQGVSAIKIKSDQYSGWPARGALGSLIFGVDGSGSGTAEIGRVRAMAQGDGGYSLLFSAHSGSTLADVMSILGTGNVGIGTTSPGAKLHISGGALLFDNNNSIQFKNAAGSAVAGLMVNTSNQTALFSAGWGMTFLNVAQTAQLMTILDAGNVGIGSTAPGAKLEVAGNINSSTGALQTAGVTRISNTGVGTFAAGTTIGGAAVTAAVVDNSLATGRLTLTSGTPITTADVTAATTVYYTPYNGNRISLYDGSSTWTTLTFSELSLSLSGYTANSNYDIWAYNNSGSVALESTIWTNDTTRATAIVLQDGVWVKSGATTRRLLGTIRITGTTGQTEDSFMNRYVSNATSRVERPFYLAAQSWTANNGGYRYWYNGNTAYKFQMVNTLNVDQVELFVNGSTGCISGNHGPSSAAFTFGLDTPGTSGPTTGNSIIWGYSDCVNYAWPLQSTYRYFIGIGYHYISLGYYANGWGNYAYPNATTGHIVN